MWDFLAGNARSFARCAAHAWPTLSSARRAWVVSGCMIALVASACSGLADDQSRSDAGSIASWGRDATPPERVDVALGSSAGATTAAVGGPYGLKIDSCPAWPTAIGGGLAVLPAATTVLERVTICATPSGAGVGQLVAIFDPTGTEVDTIALAGGDPPYLEHMHRIDLFDATGSYRIALLDGDRVIAEQSLTVAQPRQAQVRVRPPSNGRPGDRFLIDLAGWPTGESPAVDVYRAGSSGVDFHYLDSIRGSIADHEGRSEALLHTDDSPPGVYCLVARGGPLECQLAVFKLS